MKLRLSHGFLLGCCMSMHMTASMQPQDELWVQDDQVMYDIIDLYNKNNGALSVGNKQKFKDVLDLLEQEINALNSKEYDIEKYKEEYLDSYKEWEPYILQASDSNATEKKDPVEKENITKNTIEDKKTASAAIADKAAVDKNATLSKTTSKKTTSSIETQPEDKVGSKTITAKNVADASKDEKKSTNNATQNKKEIAPAVSKKAVAKKQQQKVPKKDSRQKIDEEAWLEKALAMYEVIEEYSKEGYVSADQQDIYSENLEALEKEIDALSSKKYTANEIAAYKALYVTPYKEFESFIAQETEDLAQPSPEELQIEVNAAKQQEIYESVQLKIIMYGDEFSTKVEALLEGLGEYSKASQNLLYKSLVSEVATFKSYMKSVKNNALNLYFAYVKAQGKSIDALRLTPEQHEFVSGINKMVSQAISQIEAVVLDLTTSTSAAVFASQAADAFLQYEKQTEADYQAALDVNLKLGNQDGWDALRNSGNRIMKNFENKMQDAVKKQAEEQIQKLLEEKGAELARAIGEKAGKVGQASLDKIKEKANEIGGETFDKLKERANQIGGATFFNFNDKVSELEENALKDLAEKSKNLGKGAADKVGDKIVEEIKKQASNQIGVDVDALAELVFDKKVSPEALQKVIKSRFPVSASQKNVVVQVQQNSSLCVKEKSFIKNRLKKVEETLREDFNIQEPLRLAFSFSGGGNRAMIGTLGLCIGAARHKFIDASMYLAGLSGSTWTVAPWSYMYLNGLLTDETAESKENPIEYSLQQFKTMLTESLDYTCPLAACPGGIYPPDMLSSDIQIAFANNLAKRFAYDQRITVVDLWGALISNYALKKAGPDRLGITWSSMARDAEKGMIPLPICSSIFDSADGLDGKPSLRAEYKWFESGPFEAGSTLLGFIPVWALGSKFEDGKIVSHAPEYEMSEFLGMYGSAFALTANDLIEKGVPLPSFKVSGIEIKLPVKSWIRNLIDGVKSGIRAKRFEYVHAQFANYSKGLKNSVLANNEQIGLFDGGVYFNNPLPLLFDRPERAVDVVIMYDSNPVDMQCLIDASRYFAKNGAAVPNMEKDPVTGKPITQAGLLSRLMTVFNDPRDAKEYNSEQPTLIYFPTPETDISKIPYYIQGSKTPHYIDLDDYPDIKTPIDSSAPPYITVNFKYSLSEFENLSQTMEAVFESQVDEIKRIMQLVSKKRSQKIVIKNDKLAVI